MFSTFKSRAAAVLTGAVVTVQSAMAQTAPAIPDAAEQLETFLAKQADYATPMFLLAAAAVGIMIGIKWIKRGRSAA